MKEYKWFLVDDDLNIYNKRTKRKLKPHLGSDGYIQVTCWALKNKFVHERVHVIYAHCFVPNPNNYKYVNHINSDKTDNSLENLEWCSNSYNVAHGWHSGNRTHRNNTGVLVEYEDGSTEEFASIRKLSYKLHLDRHKIARILKGEIPNRYNYKFSYIN